MIKNEIFRRVSFVIVALVTLPLWLAVFTVVTLAFMVSEVWCWLLTGNTEYVPNWIGMFAFGVEGWVRSWLGLPKIGS
jgi:hypothetical protein